MKRALFSRRWLIATLLVLSLVLVACERPLQEEVEDGGGNDQPTTVPVVPDQPDDQQPDDQQPDQPDDQQPDQPDDQQPDQPDDQQPDQPDDQQPDQPDETTDETTEVTYIVKAGDTLFKIAQRYNISVDAIAAANSLSNVDTLVPGQVLIIPVSGDGTNVDVEQPGERVHTVQAGENLFRIGLRYGFTVAELMAYNNDIVNPNRIEVGQQILIPPGGNP